MKLKDALQKLYTEMDRLMIAWKAMDNEHNDGRVTGMKIAKGMVERIMDEVDENI